MILIVDDKPENILSLRRTLELAGFEVDGAESGEEALKKVLRQDYALIILDVQMPGMDGFEVAEALQGYSKAADIPVIFLSAVSTEKKFITKGYQAGAVDYVVKPVDPDVFILKVKTLHRLHEQNRELIQMRKVLMAEVAVRKKAEGELKIKVEELRSILHSIPQIAFTLSPEGKLEFYNEHWQRLIGPEAEMATPHPDDRHVRHDLDAAIGRGEAFQAELRIRLLPEGEYRCHLLRIVPVQQEGQLVNWVGTFTDIHERKMASDVLETAVKERTGELLLKNAELETSNHELQQFASVASHDLKEPLRKIQMFGSIMQKGVRQSGPDKLEEGMGKIISIADRMSTLINDLLSYSRLSVTSAFRPTDLGELINAVIADFEFPIVEKGAQIQVGPMPAIDVIPGQMRQVFQNLISNALKFSRSGIPPRISITAGIHSEGEEPAYTFTITDNGIGFDEAYLGKIFTIFQRLNDPAAYEGTGIGLAIVKKIVDKHRGSITARSTPGAGASFILTLPVSQPQTRAAEAVHENMETYL